jgi:hypothetical protein
LVILDLVDIDGLAAMGGPASLLKTAALDPSYDPEELVRA